ncbi:MAG: hypothetical protein KJ726_05540 [Verrucomicrobia bacterium]|nr:hypothetical protein [Verrucomicrobiota bacterium]
MSEARPANAADLAKKTTARIESPAPPVRVVSEVERMRAAAKGPAQKAKSATAPIPKISIPDLDAAKKQTARIDLKEVLGGDEDIFKRRTAILDPSKIQAAEAAAAPKTIRIKRPEGAATGLIKPVSEPMTPSEPIAAEARKSETARIELPQEVAEATGAEAPTRRKTIRIKRPEGGPPTARPLVVSKPSVAVSRAEPGAPTGAPTEEEAGTVFSIVALAAVLVACVLIYVLAAQVGTLDTLIPPHMPFPGGV